MKILFLTTILLSKNKNGGEVATQSFVDRLKESGHQVKVLGYLRRGDSIESPSENTVPVEQRYTETRKSKFHSLVWFAQSVSRGIPYSAAKYYSKAYIKLVQQELNLGKYEFIIIDHAQLSWLASYIPKTVPLIFIAHNVERLIYQELGKKVKSTISRWIYHRESFLIGIAEQKLALIAKQVWTLTDHDASFFAELSNASKVRLFPLVPSGASLQAKLCIKEFDIALLGSWVWKANDEALRWFLTSVYPLLPKKSSIHIAGKGADWVIDSYPDLCYEGLVPDAQEFLQKARVIAIPTLSGGGIQIKTLDAIASGSQIVGTPIAMRGIDSPPSTVSIAHSAEEFARLLSNAVDVPKDQNSTEAISWYNERAISFRDSIQKEISEINSECSNIFQRD